MPSFRHPSVVLWSMLHSAPNGVSKQEDLTRMQELEALKYLR
jgi:hypothetical protein